MKFMKLLLITSLSLSSLAVLAKPISEDLNPKLPQTVVKSEQTYHRCSQVRITKALFFKIVDVALYLEDCRNFQGIFSQRAKVLRFSYLRKVTGEQFSEGANEYLQKNLSTEQYERCIPHYSKLNNAYQDVKKGDTYELLMAPDKTTVTLNKIPIGLITDDSCGELYLNVWFGKESMDSGFQELLEKAHKKASEKPKDYANTLNASLRASG
ncbi:chalcone isomerase family protein [Kangiella sp. TOML190]|uniref:chalcone isomerase family protein n=1 Tax=Kangiella sp. TOML190 TaxID=2931351 RepID=UPI00203C1BD3|nr:chalcone isomerase family protein [Kangiella sp. TOML190]